jgi:hypothetical protein
VDESVAFGEGQAGSEQAGPIVEAINARNGLKDVVSHTI